MSDDKKVFTIEELKERRKNPDPTNSIPPTTPRMVIEAILADMDAGTAIENIVVCYETSEDQLIIATSDQSLTNAVGLYEVGKNLMLQDEDE